MKTWLLILLLLTGCDMKWDGKTHIGGLETGPAVIRYPNNTDPNDAQPYIYPARWLLGDLKMRMQLAGIKWDQVDVTNRDGVKLHAQSNQYGLADIDEIWIEVPKVSTRKNKKVASFTVYFKKHNVFTSGAQNIMYNVSEPYLTSGSAVGVSTREAVGAVPQYAMGFYSSDTAVKGVGFDGTGLATGKFINDSSADNTFVKDVHNKVIVNEGITNYGLFSESNVGFNHINTGYTFADGYIGKAHCGIDSDTSDSMILSDAIDLFSFPFDYFVNPTTTVKTQHSIAKAKDFLPGGYVIGANVLNTFAADGWSGSYAALNGDKGGATIVVNFTDGTSNKYDFTFTLNPGDQFSFMSTTVVELNPIAGTLIEYPVTLAQNPFYIETAGYLGSPVMQVHYASVVQRVIDKNIRPNRSIDLFE